LRSFLEQSGDLGIETLVAQVYAYGQTFTGRAQYEDDFTLVGLEIQSNAGE
jgi:hypothetical protein